MQLNYRLAHSVPPSLYLFNLELNPHELGKFKGIRYVLMQGSNGRAYELARRLADDILNIDGAFFGPVNLLNNSSFSAYRVANVLSISHGMGSATMDALLHTLTKLLYYAGNEEVEYIRIGTSGGIGVAPGTLIISKKSYMPNLQAYYSTYELDRQINLATDFNEDLITRIMAAQPSNSGLICGNTIAADDFYLGQCRYDGAMCARVNHLDRGKYFAALRALDIYNFEMESGALAAFCGQAQIPAAMIAVTLVNRLESDQVTVTDDELAHFVARAGEVAINYLLSRNDLLEI